MVFSSFVFLFVFLPLVLLVYYICPPVARNVVLFLASLVFYAWGEPKYVWIMLFSTAFDYTNGRLIAYFKGKGKDVTAKIFLIIDICGNLAILGFFKYTDFFIGNLNMLTGAKIPLLKIALPIGISFYTFQTMSYTIDVYRGVVPAQKNILNMAAYVTLFPQLIAGPIVQYKTIAKELAHNHVSVEDFADGAFRFSVGLAKKVILANQIGSLWDTISSGGNLSVATAWLGAVAYSFQIYFDFSGYSDMAIGLGRMFGFHFLENFNYPYMSKSITEFWRRWHISLGSWFREYVYIPLGGNHKGIALQIRNIMIVWMLTGLWHGASWNFVIWGVYYGILLMLEKLFLYRWLKKWPAVLSHLYSVVLIVIGWTIFAQTNLAELLTYLKAMVGIGVPFADRDFYYYLSCNAVLLVVIILCCIDFRQWLRKIPKVSLLLIPQAYRQAEEQNQAALQPVWCEAVKVVVMAELLLLSFSFLVGDSYNPFLYFRF